MKTRISYSNCSQAVIDLDMVSVKKVSIDLERQYDTRVRVAFKDGQEPLDLFFRKTSDDPDAPNGPFVTSVTLYRTKGDPVSIASPVGVFDAICDMFIYGQDTVLAGLDDDGNDGSRGTGEGFFFDV